MITPNSEPPRLRCCGGQCPQGGPRRTKLGLRCPAIRLSVTIFVHPSMPSTGWYIYRVHGCVAHACSKSRKCIRRYDMLPPGSPSLASIELDGTALSCFPTTKRTAQASRFRTSFSLKLRHDPRAFVHGLDQGGLSPYD